MKDFRKGIVRLLTCDMCAFIMLKKGVLFDLDGTLWDSAEGIVASWNLIFEKNGLSSRITIDALHGMMGKPMSEIAGLILPGVEEPERDRILDDCLKFENQFLRKCGGVLFEGLKETLTALSKRYSLYIVSNCQEGYIEAFLDFHGLNRYFEGFDSWGRTRVSKGENIAGVLQRYKIDKAVYVGDTQGDCDAADFAKIPFIHAAYGFGSINRETPRAKSLAELPGIISRILDVE